MIAPYVEEYAHLFPDVKFYKVDIDKDAVAHSVAAANVTAVVTTPNPHTQVYSLACRVRFGSCVLLTASTFVGR